MNQMNESNDHEDEEDESFWVVLLFGLVDVQSSSQGPAK
jgi:hypothetical protein